MKTFKIFKSNKIILLLGFFIVYELSSCDKLLNKVPLDELSTQTFWKSENDAKLALVGVYNDDISNATLVDFLSPYTIINLDLMTDNGYEKDQRLKEFNNGEMNSSNGGVYTLWENTYMRISRCNNFLAHIDNVNMDSDEKNEMKAEVRTLRAYFYFNLEFYWSDVPLITKVLTINEANTATRTSRKKIVDFILEELQTAIKSLPESQPNDGKGRITKGAALAILGRVQMAEYLWKDAVDTYKKIIDMNEYKIDPDFKYLFLQKGENSSEIIFSVKAVQDNVYGRKIQRHCIPFMYGGWHQVNVYNSLVKAFQCIDGKTIEESPLYNPDHPYKNRDPRLYYTVFVPEYTVFRNRLYVASPDSVNAPDNLTQRDWSGYALKKFVDEDYAGPITEYPGDFAVIRYAEVLLSYLESKIESGAPITQALLNQTINKVRGRASVHMPPITETDPQKLLPILRNERRVECAFEGLRLYDLFRWKTADSILNASFYGMKLTNNPANYIEFPVDKDGYFFCETTHFRKNVDYKWPIPQREIDINPRLTQNPGY